MKNSVEKLALIAGQHRGSFEQGDVGEGSEAHQVWEASDALANEHLQEPVLEFMATLDHLFCFNLSLLSGLTSVLESPAVVPVARSVVEFSSRVMFFCKSGIPAKVRLARNLNYQLQTLYRQESLLKLIDGAPGVVEDRLTSDKIKVGRRRKSIQKWARAQALPLDSGSEFIEPRPPSMTELIIVSMEDQAREIEFDLRSAKHHAILQYDKLSAAAHGQMQGLVQFVSHSDQPELTTKAFRTDQRKLDSVTTFAMESFISSYNTAAKFAGWSNETFYKESGLIMVKLESDS